MAADWGRVARWARIGNNREDAGGEAGSEGETNAMLEEATMHPTEENEAAREGGAGPETIEAGGATHASQVAGALLNELEQTRGERDQLLDRLARLQAEFENARKREVRERADTRDYAISNAVEAFLPVMDNFQLALKAQGTLEQLRGGVELILKQMDEALRGLHVQPVESVGLLFDPRIHEALGSIETAEFPDHQVVEEVRRGYRIREKLLRPALVRIASNASQVAD